MPTVNESKQIKRLQEVINLTWEVVRFNSDYRADYVKFLKNQGLSPEDVKVYEVDGRKIKPWHPAQGRGFTLDPKKGIVPHPDEEEVDPETRKPVGVAGTLPT